MNERVAQPRGDYAFLTGLVMGGVVGAGLAMWLGPRAAAALDSLTRKGQELRDDVCDTVVRTAQDVERGAQDVQRLATDAKTHA